MALKSIDYREDEMRSAMFHKYLSEQCLIEGAPVTNSTVRMFISIIINPHLGPWPGTQVPTTWDTALLLEGPLLPSHSLSQLPQKQSL